MKSIKLNIMWNLFISLILAAVLTGIVSLVFFAVLELISRDLYEKFLDFCYSTTPAMIITSLAIMLLYLVNTIFIFTYRLNEITDSIKKISVNIHKLAKGDFREKLFIKSNHELGNLANDINLMSDKIDAYIKKEQRWNEERYNMITNMSHDLKTPIMSITGYINLIKDKKYTSEKELSNYCEIVSKKSEDLSVAINQLFELSKLHSDSLQLQKIAITLNEFMEQVVISYIPLFEEMKMSFKILINPDVKLTVDPILMKRVFENIILNSIKYASSGKHLVIKADKIDNQVTIHFINYGPMIPKEDLVYIFERYYREKKNLIIQGNGLGLAIAKTIVQLHGGSINVKSDIEKTDFFINI
ncbi:sensor histidine kinase [Anaerosacchariphilus polymeriproducens]|uniref:histidine kinase n=1 Tax=Anaerosacchariphilus polymeriproducens TaxID=1812858 RepID=A0A371B030_9FIRM|nr:HAMP domain-containing sensor histidine kinase [Anaerosacchariphilus polymeriproducens]RDU25204.1 sensor histidine kinase [Anaerosacchariphilus polymeriproducens]